MSFCETRFLPLIGHVALLLVYFESDEKNTWNTSRAIVGWGAGRNHPYLEGKEG